MNLNYICLKLNFKLIFQSNKKQAFQHSNCCMSAWLL
uniref:Uncharacterized protein n=1 Tax=Anguilla anguilla TaxID=7936 RepID=A0A0E9T077_ANGAN